MSHSTNAAASIAFAICVLACSNAVAISQRTFVASYGSDANSCSLAQPCRGFNHAISQTSSGGEVIVLDSAGYGPMTITQSVSVIAPPGIYAGITVSSGAGVLINGIGLKVALRGLRINGQGGNNGIEISGSGDVEIEDCEVTGMPLDGMLVTAQTHVSVRDSRFILNGQFGIGVQGAGGPAAVTLERVLVRGSTLTGVDIRAATVNIGASTIERNGAEGVRGLMQAYVAIRDTVITANAYSGIWQDTGYVRVERSTMGLNGGHGVKLTNGADGRIIDNMIYDNQQSGTQGSSQVCTCTADATAEVSGNALGGYAQYGFEAHGVMGSFRNNATSRQLGGNQFAPVDPI